jgi:hypothetical protein
MRNFESPRAFAAHLLVLAAEGPEVTHHILQDAAEDIADDARERIGHLQKGWAELADSTKADKERQGYAFNSDFNPLLRTGELYASIHAETSGDVAVAGYKDGPKTDKGDDIGEIMERGTRDGHIPARPVMGPAGVASKPKLGVLAAETTLAWIAGLGWKRPRLKVSKRP